MVKNIEEIDFSEIGICNRFIETTDNLQSLYTEYKRDIHLAMAIGVSKQTLSNIKNRNRGLSLRVLSLMKQKFPEINTNYIIAGEGEILLSENKELIQKESEIQELQDENIRLKAHLYEMIMNKNEDKK